MRCPNIKLTIHGIKGVALRLWIFAALLVLAPGGGARAADVLKMGSLSGVVRDLSGKGVSGVMVKIRHQDRPTTVTVFSQQGKYHAPELYPGKYEISAGLAGHEESIKAAAEVAAGKETVLNLSLPGNPNKPILTPSDWIPQLPDDRDGTRELVINRCVNCHGPQAIIRHHLDRLGWKKVILDMGRIEVTGRFAYSEIPDAQAMAANDEETERLAGYLAKHYGPESKQEIREPEPVAYRNGRTDANVVLTQFDIPTRGAIPHNLTVDAQDNIWFVERYVDKIGRLDPRTAEFQEFPIPASVTRPHGIIPDKNGMIWWTESRGNHLGRLDPKTGQMKRYPLPQADSSPHTLALGRDGTIFMTEIRGGRIGNFNPETERFKEFPIPTANPRPYGIAVDSQNIVWFCEFTGDKIGRLDPSTGVIKEYRPPTPHAGPRRLALDKQGNVWFTEYNVNKIALLDRNTGKISEWDVPTLNSGPYDIVVDFQGKVWFDEFAANKVVRFDPRNGQFTEYNLPGLDSQVRKMALDHAGVVWLSEYKNSRMVRVLEKR
ncbi:MAG: carboxypeptidase regulatory-like domain-containing protein [Acidobacteria bacterium]|nr:carboxypeptidase regulatory-like domain-containing protein [Acidobacteriota bacterium]